jgi:hypothetical protein
MLRNAGTRVESSIRCNKCGMEVTVVFLVDYQGNVGVEVKDPSSKLVPFTIQPYNKALFNVICRKCMERDNFR